jgi:Protein of unknown function (DUF2934)
MTQPIRRKGKTAGVSTAGGDSTADQMALHRRIAELAYQRFLERNRIDGHDLEDWLEAERTVLAGLRVKRKNTQSRPTSSHRSTASAAEADATRRS